MKEKNLERLKAAIELANASKELELQVIIDSFCWVVDTAQGIAKPEVVGINALFKANQKIATQKPAMLFSNTIGKDTIKKYYGFWEQLLCYLYCIYKEEQFQDDKLGY